MDDFSQILYVRDLPELDALAYELAAVCEADGAPVQAQRIRSAYLTALRELSELGRKISAEATDKLIANEHSTRVRPDTGGDGGLRLGHYLVSDPLPDLPGSVGINNETVLDTFVPWWVTNEVGSHALVGRKIYGHFYDAGFVNPSAPGDGGPHPLFRMEKGPRGIIKNPIPAREFVLKTTEEIDPLWHAGVAEVRAKLNAEWAAAMDAAAAQAATPAP